MIFEAFVYMIESREVGKKENVVQKGTRLEIVQGRRKCYAKLRRRVGEVSAESGD